MSYTLSELADDIRAQLRQQPAAACAEALCAHVSRALNDPEFVGEHLPERAAGQHPREILYEDPELGFCICGHVYGDNAVSGPHDHGSGWALYGQAAGSTEMTDWEIVAEGNARGDAEADAKGAKQVRPTRTYILNPGDAHFYAVGDVHSPKRVQPTRLIRIESENLDHVQRSNITRA